MFFLCKVVSGELSTLDDETLELKYFKKDEVPVLVNKQHRVMFSDLFNRKAKIIIS